jgi:hypothetical protein
MMRNIKGEPAYRNFGTKKDSVAIAFRSNKIVIIGNTINEG